jgi:hypothetical protein
MDGAERTEYVYLIGSEESPLIKIGRTMHVTKRLAQIQNKSPVRLSVLWQVEGDAEMEFGLHRLFKPYRAHGEWFDFADHDPVALVKEAVMLGLHETGSGLDQLAVQPHLPELPPLEHGAVVRILSDRWSGPRYGIVRCLRLNPLTKELRGYGISGGRFPRPARTFSFSPSEVEPAPSNINRFYVDGLWEKNPPMLASKRPRDDEDRMT